MKTGCLQLWKTWNTLISQGIVNSGELREFEIYSGNSCISDAVFGDAI